MNNKYLKSVYLAILFVIQLVQLSAQSDLHKSRIAELVPKYDSLPQPIFHSIPIKWEVDTNGKSRLKGAFTQLAFGFDIVNRLDDSLLDYGTEVTVHLGDSLIWSADLDMSETESINLSTKDIDVRAFDLNGDGWQDILISAPYGPSGRNSSVQEITCFFLSDTGFSVVTLASFYDTYELFRDFNVDGKIEFACIQYENTVSGEYDIVNLFEIRDSKFRNITQQTHGFPIVQRCWSENNLQSPTLHALPDDLKDYQFLEEPNVWSSRR